MRQHVQKVNGQTVRLSLVMTAINVLRMTPAMQDGALASRIRARPPTRPPAVFKGLSVLVMGPAEMSSNQRAQSAEQLSITVTSQKGNSLT